MIAQNLFGTDGIRTHITSDFLSPESVAKLGRILANLAKAHGPKCSITIGRDTRASGEYLEHALVAGVLSAGVDCHLAGILPTAGIAFLGKQVGSYFSVAISASHNPGCDNGFKIFGPSGRKIARSLEESITAQYFGDRTPKDLAALAPGKIGQALQAPKAYLDSLKASLPPDFSLEGLRVVVDCGQGAASHVAPAIFAGLGCEVRFIGIEPDGQNINQDCGSEYPENLKKAVIAMQAHIGIAFDGDADRAIFVDERGQAINGDALLAAFSIYLNAAGQLKNNAIAATVMSSMALDHALAGFGIRVLRSDVGDRQVADLMDLENLAFGGESSGHLIFSNQTACGDGLYAGLQFLVMMKQANVLPSKMFDFFKPTPLVVKNIDVDEKVPLSELPLTNAAIADGNSLGRVLFRYSGTEMKARLLVEAESSDICQRIAHDVLHEFNREVLDRKQMS